MVSLLSKSAHCSIAYLGDVVKRLYALRAEVNGEQEADYAQVTAPVLSVHRLSLIEERAATRSRNAFAAASKTYASGAFTLA